MESKQNKSTTATTATTASTQPARLPRPVPEQSTGIFSSFFGTTPKQSYSLRDELGVSNDRKMDIAQSSGSKYVKLIQPSDGVFITMLTDAWQDGGINAVSSIDSCDSRTTKPDGLDTCLGLMYYIICDVILMGDVFAFDKLLKSGVVTMSRVRAYNHYLFREAVYMGSYDLADIIGKMFYTFASDDDIKWYGMYITKKKADTLLIFGERLG